MRLFSKYSSQQELAPAPAPVMIATSFVELYGTYTDITNFMLVMKKTHKLVEFTVLNAYINEGRYYAKFRVIDGDNKSSN